MCAQDDKAWQPVAGCLPFTAWDTWEVREGNLTVRDLIEHFRAFYGLLVWSVFKKGIKVLEALGEAEVATGKTKKIAQDELDQVMDQKLIDILCSPH